MAPTSTATPRDKLKLHVAFAEQFVEFEKSQVNGFWRCLFGAEGDGRRFNSPEQLNVMLESALFSDYRAFPTKATSECVPKALKAAQGVNEFNPEPPPEYRTALGEYGKALAGLANTLNTWVECAPKRMETKQREQQLTLAGETWRTTANPNKADPDAWRYDKFLHCAVPDLDKLNDGQALLEFLARKCITSRGQPIDTEFLGKIREICIPEAQAAPAKVPGTFNATLGKFAPDFDRLAQVWGSCFRKMNKGAKKDDLESFDKAWVQALNASAEIRKIVKGQLTEPEPKSPTGPAPRLGLR